jgi:hypothetical protein
MSLWTGITAKGGELLTCLGLGIADAAAGTAAAIAITEAALRSADGMIAPTFLFLVSHVNSSVLATARKAGPLVSAKRSSTEGKIDLDLAAAPLFFLAASLATLASSSGSSPSKVTTAKAIG